MEPTCSYHDDNEEYLPTTSSFCKVEVKTEPTDELISDVTTEAIDTLERRDFEHETHINPYTGVILETNSFNTLTRILEKQKMLEIVSNIKLENPSSSDSSSGSSCSEDSEKGFDDNTPNRTLDQSEKMYVRKKNHLFALDAIPRKQLRPESIPKFKLYEREEEGAPSFMYEDEKLDVKDCNLASLQYDCYDPAIMQSLEPGEVVNSDHIFQLMQGAPSEMMNVILPQRMHFPDFADDSEEEELKCTCLPNELPISEEEDLSSSYRSMEEETRNFSSSDTETQAADDPFKSTRKRKLSSPSHSQAKKHLVEMSMEMRNMPENPPDVRSWLGRFNSWSGSERLQAIDMLISRCAADQVRHMMQAIEPLFQRDFISLLPRELALAVLGYLEPKDLLRAAQTCRYWRFLADDNLLWKEQCQRVGITSLRKRLRSMPPTTSPWKAAYMRQHIIEHNWLTKPTNTAKILKGHDDHVITCLQFYGNKILSGSDDTTLKVWSATTGKCLRTLVGHTGGVWSSQMIGRTIISGSTDRTLRVWDACTGACLRTLTGHTSTVRCMHLHNDRVVSGSRDATLRIWSVPDGKCLRVLVGHLAAVRCVQYDGRLVVSGAYDYFVKVWNPVTAECLHTLAGHTNRVYSLQFDGLHVVSGSLDTSIMVWDVETGSLKHTLMGHQSLTSGMELTKNILVSGNADSTVKVWDILTGQCLHTLSGPNKHQSAVTCLQSNSRFVITSSDDGTVKLWDVKTGEFIRNLISLGSGGSGGVVWRIKASSTKLVCAVGSRNGTEETKLMVLDFDVPGACLRCDE